MNKDEYANNCKKLGTAASENYYKKIILRRYNGIIKRIQNFGMELLITIPKWASYNDVMQLTEIQLKNLKYRDAKNSTYG